MIQEKSRIDEKIKSLEEQLLNVKGRETEQYARIVGYYRAIKNWNKGKKEEYKHRVNFEDLDFKKSVNGTVESKVEATTESPKENDNKITNYKFFFRTTCPNCPPVKNIIESLEIKGDSINADSSNGFTAAAKNNVFTAPTVIFFDAENKEVCRTSKPSELKKLLNENKII